MKILFLENHSHFSKAVIREFLSEHEVDVFPSIELAKQAVVSTSYDVALVDYDLDDGKGDEFVKYIMQSRVDLPAIAVSSHEIGNKKIMEAGATMICSKMEFRNISRILSLL